MSVLPGLALALGAGLAAQSPGDQPIPPVTYPELPREGQDVANFVPQGWKLETRADGDLNADGLADAALVLRMTDPRNLVSTDWDAEQKYDSNPRILAVLFARKGGGFELAAADHELIPRLENQNQDDPFDELAVVRGTLRVKVHVFMSAGGWQMGGSAFTFRWQDGAFRLIGFDRDSIIRNTGDTEEVSINYLTGRKLLKTGNAGSDEQNERTVTIAPKPLLRLNQIGDGLMFDPDEH